MSGFDQNQKEVESKIRCSVFTLENNKYNRFSEKYCLPKKTSVDIPVVLFINFLKSSMTKFNLDTAMQLILEMAEEIFLGKVKKYDHYTNMINTMREAYDESNDELNATLYNALNSYFLDLLEPIPCNINHEFYIYTLYGEHCSYSIVLNRM